MTAGSDRSDAGYNAFVRWFTSRSRSLIPIPDPVRAHLPPTIRRSTRCRRKPTRSASSVYRARADGDAAAPSAQVLTTRGRWRSSGRTDCRADGASLSKRRQGLRTSSPASGARADSRADDGVLLFQNSGCACRQAAGFSGGEAEELRRARGSRIREAHAAAGGPAAQRYGARASSASRRKDHPIDYPLRSTDSPNHTRRASRCSSTPAPT